MNSIENTVKNAILLKKGESVLIVYDRFKEKIAKLFASACEKFGGKVRLVKIKVTKETKREPPKRIAEAMKYVDIVLGITTISLTHTKAIREAKKKGVRVATMPGITKDMFPALGVNYKKLSKICKKVEKLFKKVKKVKIKTKVGTNLTLSCKGRKIELQDGIMDHRGTIHNLPAGEIGVAPIENSANGTIVFDTCIVGVEKVKTPVKVVVKKGKLTKIVGKSEAKKLRGIFRKADKNAKILCEFSLGVNSKARIIGKVLNDEKVLGTCHVAFGDNKSIGGKNKSNVHIDGVIQKPTIWFDGKLIMKNGKFVK